MLQELDRTLAPGYPQRNRDLHIGAVQRVIDAMHDHIYDPLNLNDMADIAHLSPYHFNRLFRRIVGIPPKQFLYALRMKEAKRLLAQTQLSVTEICFEVGYNSLGSFTTRFHELVGVTPNGYRKLAQDPQLLAETDAMIDALQDHKAPSARPCERASSYELRHPPGFDGLTFLGLFSREMPGGLPVACNVRATSGRFALPRVPDGRYSLFAVGVPRSSGPDKMLMLDGTPRGVVGPFDISDGQPKIAGTLVITMTDYSTLHPPILCALLGVLATRLRSKAA